MLKIPYGESNFKVIRTQNYAYVDKNEFPVKQGYMDLTVLKSPNSYAKYEYLIELKYIKAKESTVARIDAQLADGIGQINEYMQDKRMKDRPDLKKFVIVFSGFEVARLEQV